MSIMDDYKQLRIIENIKNFKEMEIAYKANLKLCKYQERQINKLATCIEEIKEIAEKLKNFYEELGKCEDLTVVRLKQILQKCEVLDV